MAKIALHPSLAVAAEAPRPALLLAAPLPAVAAALPRSSELGLEAIAVDGHLRPAPPADALVVLIYEAPAIAIARRLGDGLPPSAAVALWAEEARVLLRAIRRARGRLRAYLQSDIAAAPTAFLLSLGVADEGLEADAPEARAGVDPMLVLLAAEALRSAPGQAELAAELAASTVRLAEAEAPVADLDSAAARYRTAVEDAARTPRLAREAAGAERRASLLLQQIGLLEQELAGSPQRRITARAGALQAQGARALRTAFAPVQARLVAQLAEARAQRDRLSQILAEERRIHALTLRARNGTMHHLAAREADLAATRSDLVAARAESAARAQHIASLLASTSWRITAPFRAVSRRLGQVLGRVSRQTR